MNRFERSRRKVSTVATAFVAAVQNRPATIDLSADRCIEGGV
jgi:hypothetical protein